MQVTPWGASQQSLVWSHLLPFVEQPELIDWHTAAPASAPASALPPRQYPPQQSVPVAHD
jgi:hypothetical protein